MIHGLIKHPGLGVPDSIELRRVYVLFAIELALWALEVRLVFLGWRHVP